MENIEDKISIVNPHWSKDLIIRYIIVELAPFFKRDVYYFLSPAEKQMELFNNGYRPELPNIFCMTLCEQYQKVLSRFDIRSKVIQSSGNNGNVVPLYALIVEGDNGWYYLNPLKDLWSHQLHLHSNEYGVIGYNNQTYVMNSHPYLQTLATEYVEELDQELCLTNNCTLFAPEVIGGKDVNRYRKKKGLNPKCSIIETIVAKIGDISDKYLNIGAVRGPIERNLMYKFFATTVFTKPEKSLIKIYSDPAQDYAVTISVKDGDSILTFQEVQDESEVYSLIRK